MRCPLLSHGNHSDGEELVTFFCTIHRATVSENPKIIKSQFKYSKGHHNNFCRAPIHVDKVPIYKSECGKKLKMVIEAESLELCKEGWVR